MSSNARELASYASSLPQFRNRFINGDQVVDQRHAGSAGTASANTFFYATDRWYIYSVGATCGYQRVAGPNTSDYALQITPAVSNTNSIVGQKIENLNCLDLANKTVTISGKVYIDNASGVTFNTNVYVASSANSSYGNVVTFSSTLTSGEYVDFSGTVTLGANAINGIEVDFSFLSAAGKTIKLTNLQFEEGTVATFFEHRPYGLELGLCQRYYATSIPKGYTITNFPTGADGAHMIASGSNDLFGYVPFPLEMRAAPTTYIYSSTNRASGKVRNGATGTDHTISSYQPQSDNNKNLVYFSGVSSATSAGQHFTFHYVASAEL